MANKKKIKDLIADVFLLLSQILFFSAIFINFQFNIFSEIVFIWIASILLFISVIIFIIKLGIINIFK